MYAVIDRTLVVLILEEMHTKVLLTKHSCFVCSCLQTQLLKRTKRARLKNGRKDYQITFGKQVCFSFVPFHVAVKK